MDVKYTLVTSDKLISEDSAIANIAEVSIHCFGHFKITKYGHFNTSKKIAIIFECDPSFVICFKVLSMFFLKYVFFCHKLLNDMVSINVVLL